MSINTAAEITGLTVNESIFQIDEHLASLLETRQEMIEAELPEPTEAIDLEIIAYFDKKLFKVDKLIGWMLHAKSVIAINEEEAKRRAKVAKHWEAQLDHLHTRLLEFFRPSEDGKKKLVGTSGKITAQKNGPTTLEITNEALIPDEYRKMQGYLTAKQWARIPGWFKAIVELQFVRVLDNAALRESLNQPCPQCNGSGEANFDERPEDGGTGERATCSECSGTGKKGVPGARLFKGEHIRVR